MRLPFALLLLLVVPAAWAQPPYPANASGGPLLMEEAAYDVTFYDLAVAIQPATRTIEGTLAMQARVVVPTERIVLDLDDPLAVEAVETMEGAPMPYTRDGQQVWIALGRTAQPGERLALRVRYGGTPRVAPNPPWVGGLTWAQTADGRSWAAVSCQGEGADVWWPVKDHPSDEPDSMRIALTAPAGLRAVSNGRYGGRRENGDGTVTETWRVTTPINNYGVSFGVAPYVEVTEAYRSPHGYAMPVTFYVLPEHEADARRQLPQFLDHVRFLEEKLGPYPFRADGYKVLHTPYLGMEHQSLIAYGDDFTDNDFGFDWLHFHELAHEWYANLATAPDWRDMWVHEGFAEYFEALYAEDLAARNGADGLAAYHAYLEEMRGNINNVRPVAPLVPTDSHGAYFGANAQADGDMYYKGAWILKTLRFTLGDDAFFRALRRITYPDPALERVTDGSQTHFASTVDVLRAFEEAGGRALDGVFAVYLHQPALPELVVNETSSGLALRWNVPEGAMPEGAAFDIPVEVEAGGRLHRVEMPGGEGRLTLPAGTPYTVDPNRWLLRAE
jgi:aminopeptidase N